MIALATLGWWQGGKARLDDVASREVVQGLLTNVYRAFDFRDEGDIYDVLARSVSGELLTDIFLETKRSLVLANQGGAQAKVKDVSLQKVELLPGGEQGRITVEADWTSSPSPSPW